MKLKNGDQFVENINDSFIYNQSQTSEEDFTLSE